MALWTDIVNPAELTAFSRVAFDSLDTGVLTTIFPNVYQDQVKFSWKVGQTVDDLAEFGEFDTEASIGKGDKAVEKIARLLPVARKLRLSEYEQVTDPARVQALADEKADKVMRAIVARLTLARADALVSGKLALNENGVKQDVNFGRKASQTNAAPAALWSASGADPIADLTGWVNAITDASGVVPDVMLASNRIATILGKVLVQAGYIGGTSGPIVSRAVVNDVLASHSLPTLTAYEGRFGGQRVIADDKLVLAPSGGVAGGTVFAPTVEASDPRFNLGASEASGVVAGLYREDDPPVGWVLGKAIALPILANPDTTLSAKVL